MQHFIAGHFGINGNKKDLFIHGNLGKSGYEDTLKEILKCPKPLIIDHIFEISYQRYKSLDDFFEEYFTKIDVVDNHYIYIKK